MRTAMTTGVCLAILIAPDAAIAVSAGPPYQQAVMYKAAYPDKLGSGTATASASSDVNGSISASVAATSNSPAGVVFQGYGYINHGGSRASAFPIIQHEFDSIPGGSHTMTVTLNVASLSAASSGQGVILYGLSQSSGYQEVAAGMYAYFYPCESCSAQFVGFDYRFITNTGSRVYTISFNTPGTGRVFVQAFVSLIAQAVGQSASASASMTGTITNITVT